MTSLEKADVSGKKEHSEFSIQLLKPGSSKVHGAPRFGKRYVQVLFYGLLYTVAASVHNMMPICLVAMTDPTASINKNVPTYEWTQKGTILSIYFWGKMLAQTLSGWLSSRYGGKWILISANVISSILVLLQPIITYTFEFEGIVIGRFFQGVFNGFTFASIHSLLAKWAPPQERSRLTMIACSGLTAGSVISMFASGQIAASWYGWPMIFYSLGSMQLLSSLLFAYFGYDSPADHPTITEQEAVYIDDGSASKNVDEVLSTPWIKIFTSSSFFALMLVQCSFYWGFYMLITETPIYFNKVMRLDIKSHIIIILTTTIFRKMQPSVSFLIAATGMLILTKSLFLFQENGTITALPHLVKWCTGYVVSFISDWLVNKEILTIGRSRKLLVTIGSVVPCISLLVIASCDKNEPMKATIFLIIGGGFLAFNMAGHKVNYIDLSPNHAGTLMGISTQISLIFSGIGILLVQYIVTDEADPRQWKIVFYFTSAVFTVTSLIFNIYGSGTVQSWNYGT